MYCVYMHKNKTNDKMYIGITSQIPETRWANGKNYGNTTHFSRAIKKYGWNNFEHIILYENLTHDEACELEKELIFKYDTTNPNKGYNMSKGGDGGGMNGKHHSREAKLKISEARKRNGFTEEHKRHISDSKSGVNHHCARKVFQYTKDLRFVKEWEYMSKASKELKINKSSITSCCKGNRPSAGGYKWFYEKIKG